MLEGGLTLSPSAPANTLVTTSAGDVGIGTTAPRSQLDVYKASTGGTVRISSNTDAAYGELIFSSNNATYSAYGASISSFGDAGGVDSGNLIFKTGAGDVRTERMRLNGDGYLLVGATTNDITIAGTSIAGGEIRIARNGDMGTFNRLSTDGDVLRFRKNNSTVGSISVTGSATTYATSSDYRLKENIAPMTGALDTVSALKPVTYKWKIDGSAGQGFIAHELAEVVPDCVTGEKDAIETYIDEDGVEQTIPKYQGIDTSFLVATLTAAIQEQQAIITDLKARIETLEAK